MKREKKAFLHFLSVSFLFLFVSSCEEMGFPYRESIPDETQVHPPQISGLNPTYGSNAGGTEVTIYGSSFTDKTDVKVTFHKNEATILSSDPGTIKCLSPSSSKEGKVDISVTTSGGSATLPDAFRYYEDGTGRYGAILSLSLFEYVSPLFEDTKPYSYAMAVFTEPIDTGFYDYVAEESCELDPDMSLYVSDLDAGPQIVLSSGGTSIILYASEEQGVLTYSNEDVDPTYFLKGSTYSINFSGSEDIPGLNIGDALKTPRDFSVSQPNLSASPNPTSFQTQSGVNFVWTSSGDADTYMFLHLYVLTSDNSDIDTILVCKAKDDGNFSISPSYTSSLPKNRYVLVFAGKVRFVHPTLAYNNSYIDSTGELYKVGVLMTR